MGVRKASGTKVIEPGGPARAQPSGASVVVYLLSRGTELTLGRAPGNAVCLADLGVSQHHARVSATADGVLVIEDLNSTNGTFVNDERITRRTLGDGDRVVIPPHYVLQFRCRGNAVPEPTDNDKSAAAKVVQNDLQDRQHLLMAMDEGFFQSKSRNKKLALLMFEVDRFDDITETYGAAAGEAVLRETNGIVNGVLDRDDVFARYENRIFGVLMRNQDGAAAVVVAQRIRRAVKYHEFVHDGRKIRVTVSLGIGIVAKHVKSPMDFLSVTLANLARARRAGHDTINGSRSLRDVVSSLTGNNVS